MAEDKRYILAKFALEQGDRFQARDHLSSLLKEDPDNIEYWLLMSTVVESQKERLYCLQKVLAIDPQNQAAHLGMVLFGGNQGEKIRPAVIRKRDWLREVPDIRKKASKQKSGKKRGYNYKQLTPLLVGGVVLLLVLVLTGVFPGTRSVFSPKLTITPMTWTPSVDPALVGAISSSPTPASTAPIGQVLDQPYTPTPAYVLTPHPGYGTYQTALEAYKKGDFETMLTYLKQTVNQLETADIAYLVGEAYWNLGRINDALEQYERALYIDPSFAPAYFGRAMTKQFLVENYDIKADLDQALLLDPEFGQVYLERAKFYLERGAYQLAYEDADQAIRFLPGSPLAHYYRAESLLGLKDYQEAEKSILTAMELDINHVPSYLAAGRISLETGNPQRALELLSKYEAYQIEASWDLYYALGKANYLTGEDLERGLELLNQAIAMGGTDIDLYLVRALLLRELGDLQGAISDLFRARDLDRYDFDISLQLGKFLQENNQFSLSLVYLNIAERLTFREENLAQVYFWRAQTLEALSLFDDAVLNWETLLSLPLASVPDEWEAIAAEKLLPTATPTVTDTFTPTTTPSVTPSLTNTSTPSLTPTSTSTPTQTGTPTLTSTLEPTPSPSPTE